MEDKPLPALTAAEVEEVGNLVADDEWLGLAMELAIVVRSAVRESAKKSVREFTGNDECAHECRGSRTHDDQQRAATPGSVLAAHTLHHSPMLWADKIGDVSKELDARVKARVADLRGKDEYELGDLSVALDALAKEEVEKLTGKEYEFGDLRCGASSSFCPMHHMPSCSMQNLWCSNLALSAKRSTRVSSPRSLTFVARIRTSLAT
jgi:hypothetical protein